MVLQRRKFCSSKRFVWPWLNDVTVNESDYKLFLANGMPGHCSLSFAGCSSCCCCENFQDHLELYAQHLNWPSSTQPVEKGPFKYVVVLVIWAVKYWVTDIGIFSLLCLIETLHSVLTLAMYFWCDEFEMDECESDKFILRA